MHAPQIIWLVLVSIGLGATLMQDGEPKTGKHSFVHRLVATSLVALLLWWGGFFGGACS